uniref:SGTA homodimerisation domain-containing protein n=1 Tax=Arion vulgaris TaxID=1028688 RepID=A0A0B6Z8N7_9EUPU
MANSKKLVFAILKFLEEQKLSGQLDDEAKESLEVAVQCLEQVYKLNITEGEFVMQYSIPQNLLDIFTSQLNQAKPNAASSLNEPTAEQKEEAERLKNKGLQPTVK